MLTEEEIAQPLPQTVRLNGRTYQEVKRSARLAIYSAPVHPDHDIPMYEVIVVKIEPLDVLPSGTVLPRREVYPSPKIGGCMHLLSPPTLIRTRLHRRVRKWKSCKNNIMDTLPLPIEVHDLESFFDYAKIDTGQTSQCPYDQLFKVPLHPETIRPDQCLMPMHTIPSKEELLALRIMEQEQKDADNRFRVLLETYGRPQLKPPGTNSAKMASWRRGRLVQRQNHLNCIERARRVLRLWQNGVKLKDIADQIGLREKTVVLIIRGKTYPAVYQEFHPDAIIPT